MKKVIVIVFLSLLLSLFTSVNISHSQTEYVPIYFILNDSKNIHIALTNGLTVEDWITINRTVIAYIYYGAIVILTSKYPFTVNGKPAIYTYVNGRNITYFYEFKALQPQTLEINFLPKPLPNMPFGYISLDGNPSIVNTTNTTTSSYSAIIVKPTTTTTSIDNNAQLTVLLAFSVIFILIIAAVLVVARRGK